MVHIAKFRFLQDLKRKKLAISGLAVCLFFVVVSTVLPILPISDPFAMSRNPYHSPSNEYIMGTDDLGRDILSRVLWGTRASLLVGVLSAGLSTVIGIIVGAMAGFYGGWIDDFLSRIVDIFLVMPIFFLLILIVSLFGSNLLFVILAIGMVTWPRNARIMRAQTLTLKDRAFVTAAVASGASKLRILFAHLIPNGMGPVIANSMLLVGAAIIVEAGLSYLGLGDPNVISWGQMIRTGQKSFATAWWMAFFPGLMLVVLVSALNFFGDGLSDALNPKGLKQ